MGSGAQMLYNMCSMGAKLLFQQNIDIEPARRICIQVIHSSYSFKLLIHLKSLIQK